MAVPGNVRDEWLAVQAAFVQGPVEFGVVEPAQLKVTAGLELFQAMLRREMPLPPINRTLGFFPVEAEKGRVVFQGLPTLDYYNPIGSIHGGWFATLLDSCVACAVHSSLPEGKGYTTLEVKLNLVRALTKDTGPVRAVGTVIHVGGRTATAEGRIVDAEGRLYAHATTTCLVFDL